MILFMLLNFAFAQPVCIVHDRGGAYITEYQGVCDRKTAPGIGANPKLSRLTQDLEKERQNNLSAKLKEALKNQPDGVLKDIAEAQFGEKLAPVVVAEPDPLPIKVKGKPKPLKVRKHGG